MPAAASAAVAAICSAQHGSGRVPPITDAGGGAITTRVGAKGCVGECRSGVADDGTAMRGGHGSGGGSRGRAVDDDGGRVHDRRRVVAHARVAVGFDGAQHREELGELLDRVRDGRGERVAADA